MAPHAEEYDYGRAARIGVATPQANPTVEAEFSILWPRSISMQISRLISDHPSTDQRLISYLEGISRTVSSYGGMRLSAFGIACTGSSYLVGVDRERAIMSRLAEAAPYPVTTATEAILRVLQNRGFSRIAMIAPYPDSLIDAAKEYWRSRKIDIIAASRIATRSDDTTSIYELSSHAALQALQTFDSRDADAVLLSGTGMPTLNCLAEAEAISAIPVFSSNACLAWRLLEMAGVDDLIKGPAPAISGWRPRLYEAMQTLL